MKRPLPIRAIAAQTLATLRRGGASLTELLMEADARIDALRGDSAVRDIQQLPDSGR